VVVFRPAGCLYAFVVQFLLQPGGRVSDTDVKTRGGIARIVFAATVGNTLEFYDFTIFGFFATQIGDAFFPSAHQGRGILLAFGTYGVAFLARPLGAVVLGSYADRQGRRASLTLSILLMTLGTLMIACMPGFGSIGFAAPVGIVLGRLVQGFSTGGEYGSSTAFMIEHVPARRGLLGSLQSVSQLVANLLGSGVALLVTSLLSTHAVAAWGFRLPFVVGLVIAPVGLYVRRHVAETPAFAEHGPPHAPAATVFRAHWGRVLLAAGAIAGGTAGTYLQVYMPTYAQHQLHISISNSFVGPFVASAVSIVTTPLFAHLSDVTGRLWIMFAGALLMLASVIPVFMLLDAHPTVLVLTLTMLAMSQPRVMYSAPLSALLAELFPVGVRVIGMGVGYTLGVVVFGGFAALIIQYVLQTTGDPLVPAYYLLGATVITLGALVVIWRRVGLYL
jgi:MHS family proline/betaine transporter-like MFS transporter